MADSSKIKLIGSQVRNYLHGLTTTDGWQNKVTGMGIRGRDRAESTDYQPDVRLDRQTLDDISRGDAMARRGVNRVVDDSLREGWRVTFDDADENIEPEEMAKFNDRLDRWYASTMLKVRLSQHLKQARHYGGSLLMLGATDGRSLQQPLDLTRVKSLTWLRPHDRYQVTSSGEMVTDPTSKDFGYPEWYVLQQASGQSAGSSAEAIGVPVHASRVWRTDGTVLSERVRLLNEGWGDSVLQPAYEPLSAWSAAMKASKTALTEFTQGIYKISNLMGIVSANGDESLRKRFHLMDYIRSAWGSLLIDAENEDYRRESLNVAGMAELIDRHGQHLASAFDQPMTLFFGQSPGGFGKGEADGANWNQTTKAYQKDVVLPALEYIHSVLFATQEFADFPQSWSIEFNALELTNPIEDADVRLKTAQSDAVYIQSGVLDADEVAQSRFAGATYSVDTVLDDESREMDREIEEEGPSPREPLTGIQTTSMLDILSKIRLGELPKETGKTVMSVALPTLPSEAIDAMVDPIEVQPLQDVAKPGGLQQSPEVPSDPEKGEAPEDEDSEGRDDGEGSKASKEDRDG